MSFAIILYITRHTLKYPGLKRMATLEDKMIKTFGVLQGSPIGWKIGYGGYPAGRIHWGMTFSTLPGAMKFMQKQSPGKLIVLMGTDRHPKNKRGLGPKKQQ